ncbi:MAG: alpha/beta fold hydrolase [Vicinamibacteria bacterium]
MSETRRLKSADFNPPWFARGGQLQTVLGYFHRRNLRWTLPTQDLIVESEPGIRILSRATWQPGHRAASPALILLHGMGGWDASTYMLSMGLHVYAAGYHVIRMNLRGAGDSFEICPRLYNAGLEVDLVAVAREVAAVTPRVALFGASLGANHILLAVGRSKSTLPGEVKAAVAVSPPVDLLACSDALHARANFIYVSRFVADLKASYVRIQARNPSVYEAGREQGVRTVREFDERITASYAGFASAEDYYTRSSSGPWLRAIDRPTLIVSAEDDPMIPGDSVRKFELPESGIVTREILLTGGHVGFAAKTAAPGRFWAAQRALAFLDEHVRRG